MKKLTLQKARSLVKRELGISAAGLSAPPEMNGNSMYPYFEMLSGNLSIHIYTTEELCGKMIALYIGFNDGTGSIGRFYYADTLELAPEFTDAMACKEIWCKMEERGVAANVNRQSDLARTACQRHFEGRQ